jgi:hypothetical protein
MIFPDWWRDIEDAIVMRRLVTRSSRLIFLHLTNFRRFGMRNA